MYSICGRRSDGKALNCPYNVPSVKVLDDIFLLSFYICIQDCSYLVLPSFHFDMNKLQGKQIDDLLFLFASKKRVSEMVLLYACVSSDFSC